MDKFVVNIIHRPEMVPEYSATVTGQGKEEDIGDKALLTESLDIFKTQQRLAHENGLKVTIQMTYAALFNDEAVELAKKYTIDEKILGCKFHTRCEYFKAGICGRDGSGRKACAKHRQPRTARFLRSNAE